MRAGAVVERDGKAASDAAEWLTLAPAATLAVVGRTTLHYAAERGEIAYATFAGTRYFHRDDVAEWRARRVRAGFANESDGGATT